MRNIFQEYYDLVIERIVFSSLYNSCIFNDFSSPDTGIINNNIAKFLKFNREQIDCCFKKVLLIIFVEIISL